MSMRAAISCLVLALGGPVMGDSLRFLPFETEDCLASTPYEDEYRLCVGRSADQCMKDTPGGETTVGMGGCLHAEHQYWDDRLNAAYSELMGSATRSDTVMKDLGSVNAPSQAKALRDMQRAWIGFRDAACGYEYSLWGGGTGGGPAITRCLMLETGWQTLRLEARLAQFDKEG